MLYTKKAILHLFYKVFNVFFFSIEYLFFNPLIINAYVYFSGRQIIKNNWGDDINYYFLKDITRRRIVIYNNSSVAMRLKMTNYLCIGSTINLLTTSKTIIWGAGAISPNIEMPNIPKKILAVRGPLTRKYLIENKIACPAIYGDPALLMPFFYNPHKKQKYKIGLIPHYIDLDNKNIKRISTNCDINLIKIQQYESWKGFVDEICSCQHIMSSSLHGLIIAEAYGIPNTWIEFSDKIYGGHFKFHDFFLSIGKDITNPFIINDDTDIESILLSSNWEKGNIDLQPLINACPFKIKLNSINEHTLDLRSSI